MTIIVSIIIFIFGTAIGSFLSVLIYRMFKKKKGIILSRSICPSCKKKIRWKHMIPIFSWLFLGGRCAYCGKKISAHYILLELVTGLVFLASFLQWNFIEIAESMVDPAFVSYAIDWEIFSILVFYLIEFTLLIAIFFYDLRYKEIPDRLSIPAIGIAIAGGLAFQMPSTLSMAIGGIGIFLFFLIQFLLSKGKWIGGGDLRLGLLMGLLLGWEKGLLALVVSYILGAFISIALLLQGKVKRKTAIAFGPFLVTGIFVSVFLGDFLLEWYLNLLRF